MTDLKKDLKREPAPLLYDLTELQRDANKKYGYSAKTTLNLMQSLYERHKLLTYPRTDSRYLTTDIVPTLTERLKSVATGAYAPFARVLLRSSIKTSSRFVDNKKVTDHHAIIPTEQYVQLSDLTSEEFHIYDLVVKRFLAVLSPDFVYEQTVVTASAEGETFGARGKIVKDAGWKAVYGVLSDDEADEEEKEQALPSLSAGDTLKIDVVKPGSGKTKPPARYTEASLLSAMEHPEKFVTDSAMKSVLTETGGLGTPATRADIIEKLFSSFYLEKRGREIYPTSKGMQLVDLVPADLKSPLLTGQWEQQLAQISRGAEDAGAFKAKMRTYATGLVADVVASGAKYVHDNMTRTRCPNCGKFLLEVNGKKGKLLVCQDRECGYRQNISFLSNARCPNCHKKLEVFGEGEKRIYTCKCGFREKYDRFNKQLSENKAAMSKKDLAQYMKKQEDAPMNSLGSLLKDLDL